MKDMCKKYMSYMVLICSIVMCEIFIRNDVFRVGSMTFISLAFIVVYTYILNVKLKIVLGAILIPTFVYLSACEATFSPHLRGYLFLPIALLSIYKYKKSADCTKAEEESKV